VEKISNAVANDQEIVSTRVFPEPPEKVFRAWSDPLLLASWWGPSGFVNTFHDFDFKPGGLWRFTMHGPDGTAYHNKSVFKEIEEPARIVFDHHEPVHRFLATVSFEKQVDGTRVIFRMTFETSTERNRIFEIVSQSNEQNFDRLGNCLRNMKN
jgi:uncharacterized protein YndB with AHSA1/START domain